MNMDRRGATLVVVGLLLIPLTLLASLFLDMGQIQAYRSEAQLSADAAALAGGSGFIDGHDEGGGLVSARVHQYVNKNDIGGAYAQVDSLVIDVNAGRLRVVLGYQTGPLMLAPSGIRIQAKAGAQVSEETLVSADGGATQVKKLQLR